MLQERVVGLRWTRKAGDRGVTDEGMELGIGMAKAMRKMFYIR